MGWPETLPRAREEIFNDFDRALTAPEREALLALHKCLMDAVEQTIDPANLDKFKTARAQDYSLLLIKEAAIGSESEHIDMAKLAAITTREVNAGRLSADDGLHKLAISADAVLAPSEASAGLIAKMRNWLGSSAFRPNTKPSAPSPTTTTSSACRASVRALPPRRPDRAQASRRSSASRTPSTSSSCRPPARASLAGAERLPD
jgi:hypothetical protein